MSSYAETPKESEQVIGTVLSVTQKKPDTWTIQVTPDGSSPDYHKNLWTRDNVIAQTMVGMIGQREAFHCNASYWTMKDGPNAGAEVRSLWINAVGQAALGMPVTPAGQQVVAAQAAQAAGPVVGTAGTNVALAPVIFTPQPVPMGVTAPPTQLPPAQLPPDERQARIERQTASKVAAILLGYLPEGERSLTSLFSISDRLAAYYAEGTKWEPPTTVDDLIRQAMPSSMEPTGDPGPSEPYMDTDIPF